MSKKKLHMITYGCQMNSYDSKKMADLMEVLGFETTPNLAESDMVIMNTCHIREKASEKVYSELGKIKVIKDQRKAEGKDMLITVAGCVSQAEGDTIFKRAPYVDIVVGPQSYHNLPELVTKLAREGKHKRLLDLDFPIDEKFDVLPEETVSQGTSGLLTVQEGCDKFCHFCCVPFTRGAEYSRPVSAIYREAVKMVAGGTIELTLLGQNVNAYHGEGPDGESWNLGQLIKHIAKINGLKMLRYTTSHPNDMHEELFEVHKNEPKLMPYLHLPIQSGSNKILKAMNRKHTTDEYLKTIERLRNDRPDIAFSSDFIVGYPGETEQDFQDTMELVRTVKYAQCYSFKYSKRPGTVAATNELQVEEEVKKDRLARLQKLLQDQAQEFNQTCVGRKMTILFDRTGKKEGQILGRSPYMQSVYIEDALEHLNKFVEVEIIDAKMNSLKAKVIK